MLRLEVQPSSYDQAFDATLEALRDERFTLDRVDRRLGVITTRPRPSGIFLEPWKGDNATVGQAMESTLHYQRRVVRVEFEPLGGRPTPEALGEAGDPTAADRPPYLQINAPEPFFAPSEHGGTLVVNVRTFVERAHRPGLQIETVSLRESNVTVDPSLAAHGVPALFWEPVARDALMEQRLMRRIALTGEDAVAVVESQSE